MFKKGQGGRRKGIPNKRTKELQEILTGQKIDVAKRLCWMLEDPELEKKVKVAILLELMSYIYPKRKAIEVDDKNNEVEKAIIVYQTQWGSNKEPSGPNGNDSDEDENT